MVNKLPILLVLLYATAAQAGGLAAANAKLKVYQTPYYVIHTDLDGAQVREASIRMTRMFEEYKNRTAGFSGAITEKFPFYLFSRAEDYYAAGGPKKSAGVFIVDPQGARLMAIASPDQAHWIWHTVQHEGFHQFAHTVIRGQLPIWLDEGLAEYFGEAIFTGDNFVTGVVPPERLARLREEFAKRALKPMRSMLLTSSAEWRAEMCVENYDQAWSMLHFLAHGDEGKYQAGLVRFISSLGRNAAYEASWKSIFGDIPEFEKRWQAWWQGLPDDPTAAQYHQAEVLTFTSFLARAAAQGQSFKTPDEFFTAAQDNTLKCAKEDWLPHAPLLRALDQKDQVGQWSLNRPTGPGWPRLVLVDPQGATFTGNFVLSGGHVHTVTCETKPAKPAQAGPHAAKPS